MKLELSLPEARKPNLVDKFIKSAEMQRIAGRDLALAGLVHQFMLQHNCRADEVQLCEQTEWKNNVVETSWYCRRRELSYEI